MGEEERMIRLKTSCHNRCFSLGFHVDFKNRYIEFHIWNWFIHFGSTEASELNDELSKAEMYDIQNQMSEMMDKHIKAYNKDFHPLVL